MESQTYSYRNFSQILTLENAFKKDGRRLTKDDLGIIENGSVVFSEEEIFWVGPDYQFPSKFKNIHSKSFVGHILLPELVDSHTHLVFGGDRASEYSMRLNGADYQEIGKAGGGILNTMKGTNALSGGQLLSLAIERVEHIFSYGIGTIEVKSGYGLNFEKEYEISHIIDDLKKHFCGKVQIINTFMAAHAVPKEFKSSHEYMSKVVIPLMEKLASENIIDIVDIFHEQNYFDEKDTELLFNTAKRLKLPWKSHADEFADNKGAILASKNGALSTDHLLMTGPDGIETLANSSTVATLLPGTGFFLGKKQADARKFLDSGAKVAIGSDYNPGSCHWDNLLLIASLAAPQYKMNITELFAAITLNAAHSLGLKKQGAIVTGLQPRFSTFQTDRIDNITYNWGRNFSINKEYNAR